MKSGISSFCFTGEEQTGWEPALHICDRAEESQMENDVCSERDMWDSLPHKGTKGTRNFQMQNVKTSVGYLSISPNIISDWKKMQIAEAIPYLRADSFLQQGITVLLVHREQNAIGDPVEKFCS